jgi:hypothetical protein
MVDSALSRKERRWLRRNNMSILTGFLSYIIIGVSIYAFFGIFPYIFAILYSAYKGIFDWDFK